MRRALAVILLTISPPAGAQDQPRAQSLFDDGRTLMNERRFAEACPKFEESNRLDPSLGTLVWLGTCYEKLRKNASAWRTFQAAAPMAREKHDADRIALTELHIAALEAILFKLTITVPADADDPSLEVRRDGVVVPRASWGTAIALDPGSHVVTVSALERRTWEQTVEAPPMGGNVTVTVPHLPRIDRRPATPAQWGKDHVWTGVGWTMVGVGLLGGVGMGLGFGLDASSKLDTSNTSPNNCVNTASGTAVCATQQGAGLRQQALSSALVSTAAFVAGGVIAATGVVLVLVAPRRLLSIEVRPTANGLMTALGGAF